MDLRLLVVTGSKGRGCQCNTGCSGMNHNNNKNNDNNNSNNNSDDDFLS